MIEDYSDESEQLRKLGLTEQEGLILKAFTPENIKTLKSLYSENLTKEKKNIVGIRVEDLLFLLEAIKKGYLPTSGGIRDKTEEYFYLIPNPESSLLQANRTDLLYHPDVQNAEDALKSFPEMIEEGRFLYRKSAQIAAIHRNFFPLIKDWDKVSETIAKFHGEQSMSKDIAQEAFLDDILSAVKSSKEAKIPLSSSRDNSGYIFNLLYESMGKTIPKEKLQALLESFTERASIVVAFNEKLIQKYQASIDPQIVQTGNEFTVHTPEGKLPLSCIVGFESLGNFEDGILKKLGIDI